MLSVLLSVLKIIGIVLLCVVGFVLLVILLVLFVPIRYSLKGKRVEVTDELNVNVKITYLLHAVSIALNYSGGNLDKSLKIFGVDTQKVKSFFKRLKLKRIKRKADSDKKKRAAKAAKRLKTADKKQSNSGTARSTDSKLSYSIDWNDSHECNASKLETGEAVHEECRKDAFGNECVTERVNDEKNENATNNRKLSRSIDDKAESAEDDKVTFREKVKRFVSALVELLKAIPDKLDRIKSGVEEKKRSFDNALNKFGNYYELISDTHNQNAIKLIFKEIGVLLKSVRPRKIKGYLHIGSDDPATEGQILMYLSLFYPMFHGRIIVEPEFDINVTEGELYLRGRALIVVVLAIAWKLFFDKEVKRLIKKYKMINDAPENEEDSFEAA